MQFYKEDKEGNEERDSEQQSLPVSLRRSLSVFADDGRSETPRKRDSGQSLKERRQIKLHVRKRAIELQGLLLPSYLPTAARKSRALGPLTSKLYNREGAPNI